MTLFWGEELSLGLRESSLPGLASALHSLQSCSIFAIPFRSAVGTGEFVLMDGLGIACAEMACCCKRLFLFLGIEKLPL